MFFRDQWWTASHGGGRRRAAPKIPICALISAEQFINLQMNESLRSSLESVRREAAAGPLAEHAPLGNYLRNAIIGAVLDAVICTHQADVIMAMWFSELMRRRSLYLPMKVLFLAVNALVMSFSVAGPSELEDFVLCELPAFLAPKTHPTTFLSCAAKDWNTKLMFWNVTFSVYLKWWGSIDYRLRFLTMQFDYFDSTCETPGSKVLHLCQC